MAGTLTLSISDTLRASGKCCEMQLCKLYPPSWASVGICELLDFELPLLLLLLWLLIDGFDCNFLGFL